MEFIFLIALYFLPSIISGIRNTHNQQAVCIVNAFLGWTVFGWFAALIMATMGTVISSRAPDWSSSDRGWD